jgi:hypothetical protein
MQATIINRKLLYSDCVEQYKPNWDRIDARLAHQIISWNFDVILSLYIGLCRCVLDTCI